MKPQTIHILNQINQDFYQNIAASFDATRQSSWSGWNKLIPRINSSIIQVLDLGCGNGRFYQFLTEHEIDSDYYGTDSNSSLIKIAQSRYPRGVFIQHDLFEYLNSSKLPDSIPVKSYDLINLFGVMHHIPSFDLRFKLLQSLGNMLKPGGLLVASFWQFAKDPRFTTKTIPWDLKYPDLITDLEPNDYLLIWENNSDNLRYCHWVDDSELQKLNHEIKLDVVDDYFADGKTNQLNHYVVYQKI